MIKHREIAILYMLILIAELTLFSKVNFYGKSHLI